jgi:hypothetical protein
MTAPYVRDSDTSKAAAASIDPIAGCYEARVFAYIASRGAYGATADEVQAALDLSHQNGSARVSMLARRGAIVLNGLKRKTRQGRAAGVYVVAGVAP